MFTGTLVALVTPFKDGAVDEDALRALVERCIKGGVDGLVPCGTTGEAPTLDPAETERVIRACVEQSGGRIPVLAGTGSNSTHHAIENTRRARTAGAEGALVVAPYYNKPTQDGLYQHYLEVHLKGGLPVVLYNIPSRTAVDVATETIGRLCDANAIVGVKEATGQVSRTTEIVHRCGGKMDVLAGDDALTLPILAAGGKGVVSVAANLVPDDVSALVEAALGGRMSEAQELALRMSRLNAALFVETNPIPIKAALAWVGLCRNELRLPLTPISEVAGPNLVDALKAYGLKPFDSGSQSEPSLRMSGK